ncbi:MAG: hypothetical protein J5I50_07375 [Chitinophagaceae bacterium]|nr:hypothetical protein [Chitinophagaceae bacterium]
MNKHFLSSLIFSLLIIQGKAQIWRVNSSETIQSDFKQLSEAIASPQVQEGDSIYLEGAETPYETVTVNKKVVIFGTGYFLEEITNEKTQWFKNVSKIQSIIFAPGSSGTKISGLQIEGSTEINDTYITIERCFLKNWVRLADKPNTSANFDTLRQNFIYGLNSREATSTANGILVYNNIFFGKGFNFSSNIDNTSIYAINNNFFPDTENGSVPFICKNVLFQNNIMQNPSIGSANQPFNQYFNNIISNTAFSSTGNNKQNVDMNSVFVGWNGGKTNPPEGFSPDNRFKLVPNSPATLSGSINSTYIDCGAYGGDAPYIPSGMPPIPSIFFISFPNLISTPTATLILSIASH